MPLCLLKTSLKIFKVHGLGFIFPKPSIDRQNVRSYNRMGKYYVGQSANGKFLQVNDGKHIRYYGNPFWNLYRVVSKNGNDYVIHEAK